MAALVMLVHSDTWQPHLAQLSEQSGHGCSFACWAVRYNGHGKTWLIALKKTSCPETQHPRMVLCRHCSSHGPTGSVVAADMQWRAALVAALRQLASAANSTTSHCMCMPRGLSADAQPQVAPAASQSITEHHACMRSLTQEAIIKRSSLSVPLHVFLLRLTMTAV